jgi:cytochrome c556
MIARTLLLLALSGLTLTACDRVDPNSPLGQRQALFKQMLHTSEDLGGMLRGRIPFDDRKFAEGAAQLDQLSHKPWQHFPQSRDSHSDARDEVWQRQERFQQLARDLEASTAALVAATTQAPLTPEKLTAPVAQVEKACKACHQEFRVY